MCSHVGDRRRARHPGQRGRSLCLVSRMGSESSARDVVTRSGEHPPQRDDEKAPIRR